MQWTNMKILDLFNVGTDAPWEIEVELSDRECNREDYIIPLTEEILSKNGLITRIESHLLDYPLRVKSSCTPRKSTN